MAEEKRKQQYPIRLDISQQGAARAGEAPNAARGAGAVVGPALAAVARNLPSVLAFDAFRRGGVAAQGAAADFAEGLVGAAPGSVPRVAGTRFDPDRVPAARVAAALTKQQPQAERRAQPGDVIGSTGPPRNAPRAITPRDRLSAAVDTVLSGPFTLRALTAAAGALPGTPNSLTPKEATFGQTAKLSESMFAETVAQAQAMVASGDIDAAQAQEMIGTAQNEMFQRNAGLLGFNPMQLQQAMMLEGAGDK